MDWKGKHLTDEAKRKISQTRREKYGTQKQQSDPSRKKIPRPVSWIGPDGQILRSFISVSECIRYFESAKVSLSSAYIKKLLRNDGWMNSKKMINHTQVVLLRILIFFADRHLSIPLCAYSNIVSFFLLFPRYASSRESFLISPGDALVLRLLDSYTN